MARHLFVYWRVNRHDATAALSELRRLQAQLRIKHPMLMAQAFERVEANVVENTTLMETYALSVGSVDEALAADIELSTRGLDRWRAGLRHVEVFETR